MENIKVLDSKIYTELKKNGTYEYTDNNIIHKFSLKEDYIDYTSNIIGERLTKIVSYYENNLSIKEESIFFSRMTLGIYRKYNPEGSIIEEVNFDSDYAFTFNSFINKAKEELNIDLNDSRYIVRRYVDEGVPSYFIRYEYNINGFKYIKIDGTSGDIIFNKFVPRTE